MSLVLPSMSWKYTNILIKSTCCTYTIPLLCHHCILHSISRYFVRKSSMWFPTPKWKHTDIIKHSEVHVSQLLNNIKGARYNLAFKVNNANGNSLPSEKVPNHHSCSSLSIQFIKENWFIWDTTLKNFTLFWKYQRSGESYCQIFEGLVGFLISLAFSRLTWGEVNNVKESFMSIILHQDCCDKTELNSLIPALQTDIPRGTHPLYPSGWMDLLWTKREFKQRR